jgi:hypothetical protein
LNQINVWSAASHPGGSTKPVPPPEGLDYDFWLGPAPQTPYTDNKCFDNIPPEVGKHGGLIMIMRLDSLPAGVFIHLTSLTGGIPYDETAVPVIWTGNYPYRRRLQYRRCMGR